MRLPPLLVPSVGLLVAAAALIAACPIPANAPSPGTSPPAFSALASPPASVRPASPHGTPEATAAAARITVTLNGTPTRAAAPLMANFNAQATAAGAANFTFSWSFGDGSSTEWFNLTATGGSAAMRTNHTFPTPGTYTVNVSATDNLLDQRGSATLPIQVAGPFVVTFNLTPPHPIAGRAVVITPVVSGGITPYHAAWTGVPADCYAGAFNLTCVPGAPGNYSVRVTVTDATVDRFSEDLFLNVVPHLLVTASYKSSFSCSGTTGVAIYNFTAAPTGGQPPENYSWTFGNGVPSANGSFVSVSLPLNEMFVVTVVAEDAINEEASATVSFSTSFPACGAVPPPNYAPPRLLLIGAVVVALGIVAVLAVLVWRTERARRPPPPLHEAVPAGASRDASALAVSGPTPAAPAEPARPRRWPPWKE